VEGLQATWVAHTTELQEFRVPIPGEELREENSTELLWKITVNKNHWVANRPSWGLF
jgi:hypothetical protein